MAYKALGVVKEVAITRRLDKPIFQITGYKDTGSTAVPNGGSLLRWM